MTYGDLPPERRESYHLLAPQTTIRAWLVDMMQLRILWFRFTIVALLDGFSRKLLRLKVFIRIPTTSHMHRILQSAIQSFEQPRFIITDHGSQFMATFKTKPEHCGITVVQGKLRQSSFNSKVERLFRTLRIWLRIAVAPNSVQPLQRKLDRYNT